MFGSGYEPWIIFILPPGGFLTIGFILLVMNWWEKRKAEKARAGIQPEGAVGRAA